MVLGGKLIHNVQAAYKVGKMALKLLDHFDASDLLPGVYMVSQSLTLMAYSCLNIRQQMSFLTFVLPGICKPHYGYITVHIKPFRSCTDTLKQGFEIGLSTGDIQTA